MADRWGHWSGVDFDRRIAAYVGQGNFISGGALTQRDDGYDQSEVTDSLNAELRHLWMRICDDSSQDGGPQKLMLPWDFTYPSGAEYVALKPGAPAGTAQMTPPFPGPWIDLYVLYDRTRTQGEPPLMKVPYESFWQHNGTRWSYAHDSLYFSNTSRRRGPTRDYSLRLLYVPQPELIDIASAAPRTDIPIEVHEVLAMGAAIRLLERLKSPAVGALREPYARDLKISLASLSKSTEQPTMMNWTKGYLTWN